MSTTADQLIVTETADLFRLDEKVLVIKFKTDQLAALRHAREIDEGLMHLANNTPHFVIVDALGIQSNMAAEAQKYFSRESQMSRLTIGAGILLNNLPIRLTASVFIKFFKPVYPAKIFSTELEALEWFEKLES